jgi:hypothetical protein
LKKSADRYGRGLVEQNPHLARVLRRLVETAGGKLDDGFHLLAVKSIEPFHDIVNTGSGFEVLEDGGHWHPGSLENPCAADFAGNALDGRAL